MKTIFSSISNHVSNIWHWYKSQYHGEWYQKVFTPILTSIVLFFLYLGAVDINFLWLFGKSPSADCIQNPISNEASLVYSSDSVLIGKYYNENRSPVDFDDISPYVIDALISTEDERFYQHHGIDYQGLAAAAKDMVRGNARGASTITQQLVKNLFKIRSQYSTGLLGKIPGLRILIMKSKEWVTAIKIENRFSKQDILTLYLNTVDFGSNAYGLKTAAKSYFKTTPDNLTAEQAAVLVGLLKATTTYNPKLNPKNSLSRRNVVLNNMYTHGKLSKEECDSLCKLPLELKPTEENPYDGQALYFREAIRAYLYDWAKENDIDLFSDGLRIYTSIDTRLQAYAEFAVEKEMKAVQELFDGRWSGGGKRVDHHYRGQTPWRDQNGVEIPHFIEEIAEKTSEYKYLAKKFNNNTDSIYYYLNLPHKVNVFTYENEEHVKELELSTMDSIRYMVSFMHCSFVAMEPQTSHVKAWVGDINFDSWKYDKATSMRQPGSVFKLFVYASAFENSDMITPKSQYKDSYVSMQVEDEKHPGQTKLWAPHNADGHCTNATMTLRSAFAKSVNTIAVKLGQDTGIDNVAEMAKSLGVNSPMDRTPALALGSSDVQLLEMVSAYSTVMNDGIYKKPVLVTKIVDRTGKVIFDCNTDKEYASRQAIKKTTAIYMQQLLYAVTHDGGGTGLGLSSMAGYDLRNHTDFGGKTGTSSNHSDAWFVGCTPNLVGAAWVGGEYRCIHFASGKEGQGNRTAMPVFAYFMRNVLDDSKFYGYRGKFVNK